MNNNPAFSGQARSEGAAKGESSRLIVEFSVENHAKLKLQQVCMAYILSGCIVAGGVVVLVLCMFGVGVPCAVRWQAGSPAAKYYVRGDF